MNTAEKVLEKLHLRRRSAETEVKVEDPDGKVKIKERVEPTTAQETAPERDVHPNTPPATDPASPKVNAIPRMRCRAPHPQLTAL